MKDPAEQEKLVDQYVREDNKQAAVKLLFQLIVGYAKSKNFTKAESLRDKLFEVDAMALTEIVESGEIIEIEKSSAIDTGDSKLWSELYSTLSTEETNAFYYALNKNEYQPNEYVFEQGQQNNRLYFINQGQLNLVFCLGDQETLLTTLTAGDTAGEDTFFSISFCTTSLIARTRVELDFLERAVLEKWEVEVPGLEAKLKTFSARPQNMLDLFRKKGLNRRSYDRALVNGRAAVQLVDASGQPVGKPFKGDLYDISAGGVSFFIKSSKKKVVRKLLGQRLTVNLIPPAGNFQAQGPYGAQIVAVKFHMFNDYSVHVRFDKAPDPDLLMSARKW